MPTRRRTPSLHYLYGSRRSSRRRRLPAERARPKQRSRFVDAVRMALLIAVFGAIAGFVSGLTESHSYKVRLPTLCNAAVSALDSVQEDKTGGGAADSPGDARDEDREAATLSQQQAATEIEIGFLGDILVGAVTAVAAFFFFGAILGFASLKFDTIQDWLKLFSLSILTGFMGIELMFSMTHNLQGQFDTLNDSVAEVKQSMVTVQADVKNTKKLNEATILIQEGIAKLNRGKEEWDIIKNDFDRLPPDERRVLTPDMEGNLNTARKYFNDAVLRFDRALEIAPDNTQASIEKAKALKSLSLIAKRVNDKKEQDELLKQAIQILDEVLAADNANVRAYYNRACYHALYYDELDDDGRKQALNNVIADLKRIQSINTAKWQSYKKGIPADSDFSAISKEQTFVDIFLKE